ncbi:MAG: hypothetical protein M1834_001147 [Cirrosporium novae-zelandiae]|nr:MAG: hypothetical protein M1834_001147 [Cirrosporium novae-zelandiae]
MRLAVETLVPFSTSEPSLFKRNQLEPIKDLKLLIRDYAQIAHNAITIMINLTASQEDIRDALAGDDKFLLDMVLKITTDAERNADSLCMLLTNLSKSDILLDHLLPLERKDPPKSLSTTNKAMDQLMAVFVKGERGKWNKHSDYDYLAYVFGDLAKNLLPFTDHASLPRRLGVTLTLKNTLFDTSNHLKLLSPPVSLLPYLLMPLCGPDTAYTIEETEQLLSELQFLGEDKKRERDTRIIHALLECLMLISCGSREAREIVREAGSYLVVRELHVDVEDEGVREVCERLVDVLQRDEAPTEEEDETKQKTLEQGISSLSISTAAKEKNEKIEKAEDFDDEDDDKVVEIF